MIAALSIMLSVDTDRSRKLVRKLNLQKTKMGIYTVPFVLSNASCFLLSVLYAEIPSKPSPGRKTAYDARVAKTLVFGMSPLDVSDWLSVQADSKGLQQTLQCHTCQNDDMKEVQLIYCESIDQELIIVSCKRCSFQRSLVPDSFHFDFERVSLLKSDARPRAETLLGDLASISESSQGSMSSNSHDINLSSIQGSSQRNDITTNHSQEEGTDYRDNGKFQPGANELREVGLNYLQSMEATGSLTITDLSSFVSEHPSVLTGKTIEEDSDDECDSRSRFETALEEFDVPNQNAESQHLDFTFENPTQVKKEQFAVLKKAAKKMFKPVALTLVGACAVTVPGLGVAGPIVARVAGRVAVEAVDSLIVQKSATTQANSSKPSP